MTGSLENQDKDQSGIQGKEKSQQALSGAHIHVGALFIINKLPSPMISIISLPRKATIMIRHCADPHYICRDIRRMSVIRVSVKSYRSVRDPRYRLRSSIPPLCWLPLPSYLRLQRQLFRILSQACVSRSKSALKVKSPTSDNLTLRASFLEKLLSQ